MIFYNGFLGENKCFFFFRKIIMDNLVEIMGENFWSIFCKGWERGKFVILWDIVRRKESWGFEGNFINVGVILWRF